MDSDLVSSKSSQDEMEQQPKDKKINELPRVQFSCPKDKDKMIQLILKIQEEARLKFQALKSQEISSEVSYFREITDAWGLNPSENHKEFQPVLKKSKTHQFKDSQNAKRKKKATSSRGKSKGRFSSQKIKPGKIIETANTEDQPLFQQVKISNSTPKLCPPSWTERSHVRYPGQSSLLR
ncbi:hypothetical protein NPIL_285481 [Nephila pilipes]|uniref:Uncharacterized protein n=1 Tax=Nephila pilipes TaxID=299642 RepID=A0A8X6NMX1_NEPPI|nr:hypothetical protein NPIL_285481 [Nephila pilipes]